MCSVKPNQIVCEGKTIPFFFFGCADSVKTPLYNQEKRRIGCLFSVPQSRGVFTELCCNYSWPSLVCTHPPWFIYTTVNFLD